MKKFFKPTKAKVIYAAIYTLVPILLALPEFIVTGTWDGILVLMILVVLPLLFVGRVISGNDQWANDLPGNFLYYYYPIISFLVWYCVSCIIAFYIKDRRQYHTVSLGFFFLLIALYLLPLYFPEVFP
jgi:hypothetical protein